MARADLSAPDVRRTDLRHRTDLLWRVALAVAGLGTALLGAPRIVSGLLVLAALLAAVERLARRRRLGLLDALLVVVGGGVVTLVLVGLVLGSTAIGLHPTTWAVALSAVSVVALAVAAAGPRPEVVTGRSGLAAALGTVPWVAASLVVVGIAVTMSARSVDPTQTPPLQLSLGKVSGTSVQVVVTASTATGPLELRTTSESGDAGTDVSYPLFTVDPGRPTVTTIALPTTGRYVITVNNPDQTQPLRTLTLDR